MVAKNKKKSPAASKKEKEEAAHADAERGEREAMAAEKKMAENGDFEGGRVKGNGNYELIIHSSHFVKKFPKI
jgi:predicted  nucleic acid-binding Zn-ribbon protein